jgi:hypothetical protein
MPPPAHRVSATDSSSQVPPRDSEVADVNVRAFFLRRGGWSLTHESDVDVYGNYELSLQGIDLAPPRVSLESLGVQYLSCVVRVATGHVWVSTAGAVNGCPEHNAESIEFSTDAVTDPDALAARLEPLLAPYEAAARSIDLGSLCACVLTGPCSRRRPVRGGGDL